MYMYRYICFDVNVYLYLSISIYLSVSFYIYRKAGTDTKGGAGGTNMTDPEERRVLRIKVTDIEGGEPTSRGACGGGV